MESTFEKRSVVFLSDVEVLVRSSTGVGFARSASVAPVVRVVEFVLRRGIVRVLRGLLTKGLQHLRRCRMRRWNRCRRFPDHSGWRLAGLVH